MIPSFLISCLIDQTLLKGEIYWNTRRKFYFINQDEWRNFLEGNRQNEQKNSNAEQLFIVDNFYDCNYHLIKNKKINYMTYFDKKRENYSHRDRQAARQPDIVTARMPAMRGVAGSVPTACRRGIRGLRS